MSYGLTKSIKQVRASSQYSQAPDSATLSVTGNLTLETWVKCEVLPNSGIGVPMMFKGDYNLINSYQLIYLNDAGTPKLEANIYSATGNANIATSRLTQTLTIGTWFHVAVVVTVANAIATKFEFFINGVSSGNGVTEVIGTAPTSIFDSGVEFGLGMCGNPIFALTTYVFDGNFSLARVWATARTQSQISANMCVVLGSTSNLQAEWTLDNVYTDNSGNSNTLTGYNTPTFPTDTPATCAVVSNTSAFFQFM